MLSWLRATNPAEFFKTHWLAILLIVAGTFLRFYHLPEKGILFGDSGRDLLVAATAVETGNAPLLGIASSLPRFHQGPLTIWLSMALYALHGFEPAWYFWTFAFIGCLALIAIYEFSLVWLNQRVGLIALALLAFSPLAIAHSRMVYHTVPIAVLTVLVLWFTTQLMERRTQSWPWAVLMTALLFQHELSLFPVFAALPLAWWVGGLRQGISWQTARKIPFKTLLLSAGSLALGLLPQIISELRDGSQQLSGFALWLGYRVISFFLPTSDHFAVGTFGQVLERFAHYGSRVFMVPDLENLATATLVGLVLLSLLGWMQLLKKTTLSAGASTILLITGLITAGYLVHGAPSEAYFPVYVILLPLLIAIGLATLPSQTKLIGHAAVALVALFAVVGIWQANFFVDQTHSWNYGPSVGSQKLVLEWIEARQTGELSMIGSKDPDGSFENYLSSYVWLCQNKLKQVQSTTQETDAGFLITHQTGTHQRFSFSSLSEQTQLPSQLNLPAVQVMMP